jgi:AcrR family transcriptional regulator
MERENQRVVITRRMLKESMLKILKEKDLDSISVAELCREAGINRSTFYRHYEILRDVLTEIQRDFYKEMKQQTNMPKSPEDIRTAVEKLCVLLNAHRDVIRIFIRNNSDKDFIRSTFGAIACEMEGAAVGQVCYVNSTPCCVMRAISDGGDDNAAMDYPTFAALAATQAVKVILRFLNS